MAAALLERHLGSAGVAAAVRSSGRGPAGVAAPERAVATMAAAGVDLTAHRSAVTTVEAIEAADVVLAMSREHARDAIELVPGARSRTFTLKQLVRLAEAHGGPAADETVDAWLVRLDAHRGPGDLLGAASADDVADPIGRSKRAYRATARELDDLTRRLSAALA
jgi:protein-tyrosine phosphatase